MHQLGQHHRERVGRLRGERPEPALPAYDDPAGQRADLGHHRPEPVGDLVEVDRLLDGLAQRLVHDCDRADPTYGLLERELGGLVVDPTRLEAQQRGDGLEVVLHPVVDLADRGVLGDQLAVAAAQVGHVTDQDQPADVPPAGTQRDRADDERDALGAIGAVGADLDVAVGAPAQRGAERLLVGPTPRRHEVTHDVGQRLSRQVAGEPEPAEDRLGVGAGVGDAAAPVDPHEPVADAG